MKKFERLTVVVLSYWSINNQLTWATVVPHVKAIQSCSSVGRVLLLTPEFGNGITSVATDSFLHVPVLLPYNPERVWGQVVNSYWLPTRLAAVLEEHSCDILVAHGAMAGALAYKVWQKTKVAFYVSSFEPHADYMQEPHVWHKYGLKYLYQKRQEQKQKKHAAGLMPVSNQYVQKLLFKNVLERRIKLVPCVVEQENFRFRLENRQNIRSQLGWQQMIVGIYVGKFGGLYYKEEAFTIYKKCFQLIPGFRLIILSPQPQEEILLQLQKHQIDVAKVCIASVPHNEVPQYLSAADFAFATVKSYPSARYCSPVKIGEYWANGLPVLLTEGVGDDSDIIQNEGGGATFNLQEEGNLEQALEQIQQILKDPNHRLEIPELARKYRSPERVREAYEYFFSKLREGQA